MFGFVSPRLQIRFEPGEGPDNLKIFGPDGEPFQTLSEVVDQRNAAEKVAVSEPKTAAAERELAATEPPACRNSGKVGRDRGAGVPRPSVNVPIAWQRSCESWVSSPTENETRLQHQRPGPPPTRRCDRASGGPKVTKASQSLSTPGPDPYDEPQTLRRQIEQVRSALDRRNFSRVIETGTRYLLNPRLKHDPTLMDPDPAREGRSIRLSAPGDRPGRSRRSPGRLALVGLCPRWCPGGPRPRPLDRRFATAAGSCRASSHPAGIRARAWHVH